jgi:hypothetical protein
MAGYIANQGETNLKAVEKSLPKKSRSVPNKSGFFQPLFL